MTLARFMKAELAAFKDEHPAAEGWTTHVNCCRTQVFMPVLPAFLRAQLKPEEYAEKFFTHVAICARKRRLTSLPYRPRGSGIYEENWSGEIRLTWKGVPIHVRRIWTPAEEHFGPQDATLIATTDISALEGFWKEGLKFARYRRRGFNKSIIVVNGPDLKRPTLKWNDVILPNDMKAHIRENFEAFLKAKTAYKELGLPYRRGFLFVGPPGNGKTLVSKVIASEYRVNMVTLHIKSDLDERIIDTAFSRASSNPPCVLLLEDLDKLINGTRVSLSYLLNLMDGLSTPEGIIVIATTNNPERLDPALLHRPSRFDRVWDFKLPGFAERLALLKLKNKARFSDAAVECAAQAAGGFSMAYVQEVITSAQLSALHAGIKPTDAHLDAAVAQLRLQIKTASGGSAPIGSPASIGFTTPEAP